MPAALPSRSSVGASFTAVTLTMVVATLLLTRPSLTTTVMLRGVVLGLSEELA